MTTAHQLPWAEGWTDFRQAVVELNSFERSAVPSSPEDTDALMWRHWQVAYSVYHAMVHAAPSRLVGVECGTADGYTAHIALTQMRSSSDRYEVHLYDAWGAMPTGAGLSEYSALSQETARRNLAAHADRVEWHTGYIPESFDDTAPNTVHWLHIDLNSADATREALDFFGLAFREVELLFSMIMGGWLTMRPGLS